MIRVGTSLPEEVEALVSRTIGCAIEVHRHLGPGLLERIYARALSIELGACGIAFVPEQRFPIYYRGHLLHEQRVDLVVEGQLIVEVKAVENIAPVHQAQVLSYLRASEMRVGLLMNFNAARLADGLRRIVL